MSAMEPGGQPPGLAMSLDERMRVRTPEHVELQFVLAGAGNRFLAVLADLIIQGFALLGLFVLVFGAMWLARESLGRAIDRAMPGAGIWMLAAIILFLFLFHWGYFVIFETVWSGQTPGKRLVRIRVVREDGRPIGFAEAAIRNLLRVVLDSQPANLYAVGFITGMLNARFKRLGDFAAGTVVIRERRQRVPRKGPRVRPPGQAAAGQAGPPLRQLAPEEAAALQAFMRRRDELDAPTRAAMAGRIAASLRRRLELAGPPALGDEAFLEWLDEEVRKTQAFR
jgi:uncharacterized RDD family membrane protein YckC